MSELIKNLLEIQVLDAGKMMIHTKEFSLNTLIKNYVAHISHMAAIKLTEIEITLPETDVMLISDAARVEQILDNYVSNAIKYSPAGSKVYISLETKNDLIDISVQDEGPGLKQDEIDKLFQQFSTASSVPRPGEHATGLGLAIVKKIADALNAHAGCESEIGKGSTFYIRFQNINKDLA